MKKILLLSNGYIGGNQPQLTGTKTPRLAGRLLTAATLIGVAVAAQPVLAVQCTGAATDPDTCTSRTTGNGNVCAGDLFGSKLNCTANDVAIAGVTNIRDASSGQPITTCTQGSQLDFTADFAVQVNGGVTRFDLGLYFSTDSDPNKDGAASGACSVSKLSNTNDLNFKQLDSSPDSCGDIDNAPRLHTVKLPLSIPCAPSPLFFNASTGQCQATAPSAGAPKCVSLPNLVSWRQTGANNLCTSPLNTFPGSPSKCRSDVNFGIPIRVESVQLVVEKTASPITVQEPGGAVTFTVKLSPNAQFSALMVDTLNDSIYGDLLASNNTLVTSNNCPALAGQTIAAGGFLTCSFSATVSGNANTLHTNIVGGCGTANGTQTCDTDDATVSITDVAAPPSVTKTITSLTTDVTYTVQVNNTSAIDTLTINSLMDNKFGDITSIHIASTGVEEVVSTTCASGGTIAKSSNYSCTFVGRLPNNSANPHTNTVTANATDDDGVNSTPTDTATITITTQ